MTDTTLQVIFEGTDKTLSSTAKGIGGTMSGLGKTIAGGLAIGVTALAGLGVAAVGLGAKFVSMGSDAAETSSLIETSLGAATETFTSQLRDFAGEANRSFYELQQGSSTLIAMTKSMGASEEQAADFGVTFAMMASDLGSFFNRTDTEVFQDIQSALAGSSETMQKYGIDIRETTLKNMALEQGLISTASDTLPQLIRAQLIQQAITEQGADAMGDAIRTNDSWANSMRGMQAMFTDFGTEVGMQLIPALQPLLALFLELARDALPVVAAWITSSLIPAITDLSAWLGVNLPIAIQLVSEYWTSVLKPALEAAWLVLSTLVIPYIQNVVIPVISAYLVFAIQTLSDMWTNVLQPALTAVWTWLSTVLMPFIETVLVPWLQENIPLAIQTLSDFWTNTLLPALQRVYDFIFTDMWPIWESLGNFFLTAMPIAITALQGTWENVLLPSMQKVWSFINDKLGPVFEWLKNDVIGGVASSFGGLSGAIQAVAGWIDTLTGKLSTITLPDWMTPGSPTPWQIGLEGVSGAMAGLYKQDLPALNTGLQGLQATSQRTTNINQTTNIYTSRVDTRGESNANMRFALGGI